MITASRIKDCIFLISYVEKVVMTLGHHFAGEYHLRLELKINATL